MVKCMKLFITRIQHCKYIQNKDSPDAIEEDVHEEQESTKQIMGKVARKVFSVNKKIKRRKGLRIWN